MSLDNIMPFSNEDSELQYLITFEHNYHSELIIDYELVEVIINNKEFIRSDYVNEEMDVGNNRESIKGKEKEATSSVHVGSIDSNTALELQLPTFNPIQNLRPLHKGYPMIPHEY
ncbi:3272_t:CDS:2 [Cetraspora pellucida]|uniref:3272_t:CDS:1 n=1 Tax=Cetraspora pellucida TaxID=1433469 RepID=A0ACA9LHL0_9GLOM|nr:3272_t:CDS:2 [Cetraspora pellucida]